MTIDLFAVIHLRAGKTDELPADQSGVAAVHGVAEHTLDGVRAENLEEVGLLDGHQLLVLLGRREAGKAVAQILNPGAVNFARRIFSLVTVLRHGIDPRAFRIAVFVAPVGSAELAVDIDHHAGFLRAGAGAVAGKDAVAGRRHNAGFGFGEKAQRDFDAPVLLRGEPQGFARQRVNQNAPERLGGQCQEFAPFHTG